MNEVDDAELKAEIEGIMERVNRIMQGVGDLDTTRKETPDQTEE